jgi:hypothetical protein
MAAIEVGTYDDVLLKEGLNRVPQAVESAMYDARLIIEANDFRSVFKFNDLTELVRRQRKVLVGFVAEDLLRDELEYFTGSPKITRFARRLVARKGWQREKQPVLEASLSTISRQNARYLDKNDAESCPQAEIMKTLVDGFFAVIKTRTKKPIGYPYEAINKDLLETWKKGFGNTFDLLFSSQ